jgi:hypothetical protein
MTITVTPADLARLEVAHQEWCGYLIIHLKNNMVLTPNGLTTLNQLIEAFVKDNPQPSWKNIL